MLVDVPDPDPKDVPDLDLPPPRRASSPTSVTAAPAASHGPAASRTPAPTAPASSAATAAPIASDDDDDFGLEIERGGALVSSVASMQPPARAARTQPNLDVAYRRLDASPARDAGPSLFAKIAAWVVPLFACAGGAAALVRLAHRRGGVSITSLLPHAFDASSAIQSGAVALAAFALALTLGLVGLRLRPRSYAMIGSAAALLVTSLAMVTVTLVATEEQPTAPDGALLMPYVVPAALALLGLAVARRAPPLFLDGGARRGLSVLAAALGGALAFAAVELSALASRLP